MLFGVGAGGQIAWADPATGISVAFVPTPGSVSRNSIRSICPLIWVRFFLYILPGAGAQHVRTRGQPRAGRTVRHSLAFSWACSCVFFVGVFSRSLSFSLRTATWRSLTWRRSVAPLEPSFKLKMVCPCAKIHLQSRSLKSRSLNSRSRFALFWAVLGLFCPKHYI